jgi:hypothetical protein
LFSPDRTLSFSSRELYLVLFFLFKKLFQLPFIDAFFYKYSHCLPVYAKPSTYFYVVFPIPQHFSDLFFVTGELYIHGSSGATAQDFTFCLAPGQSLFCPLAYEIALYLRC